jgi:transposase
MGAARHVRLSVGEDEQLRLLEQGEGIHPKVRLRASVLRLSNQDWTVPRLAVYFKRNHQSIHNDFDRWEGTGVEGLADGKALGNPGKITAEMEGFIREQVNGERCWDSSQLGEALKEKYGVVVKREAVRMKLLEMGYSWQRSRYESGKEPDTQEVQQAQDNIETLKRGRWKTD